MELFFFHGKAVTLNYHISVVRNSYVSDTKTKQNQSRTGDYFPNSFTFFFLQKEQAVKKKN